MAAKLAASDGTPEVVRPENRERAVRTLVPKLGGTAGLAARDEVGPGGCQRYRLLRMLGVGC